MMWSWHKCCPGGLEDGNLHVRWYRKCVVLQDIAEKFETMPESSLINASQIMGLKGSTHGRLVQHQLLTLCYVHDISEKKSWNIVAKKRLLEAHEYPPGVELAMLLKLDVLELCRLIWLSTYIWWVCVVSFTCIWYLNKLYSELCFCFSLLHLSFIFSEQRTPLPESQQAPPLPRLLQGAAVSCSQRSRQWARPRHCPPCCPSRGCCWKAPCSQFPPQQA